MKNKSKAVIATNKPKGTPGRKSKLTNRQLFNLYKETYAKAQQRIETKKKKNKKTGQTEYIQTGFHMNQNMITDFQSFKMTFASKLNFLKEKGLETKGKGDNKKVVKRTQKPAYKRVVEEMVADQTYDVRMRAARAQQKYIKSEFGRDVNLTDILFGVKTYTDKSGRTTALTKSEWSDVLDAYKARKEELAALDYSHREQWEIASKEISVNIFGSK